ncbi:hypothetical protein ANCDUO_24947 [Ancylostoma duodenale]|uniref:Protein furry C-terminal domain-containing protein n=1 Tax=Ancylostoma duodenale TaxID=51022 RepID=A0A0C2BMJ1_9BILA|nr:hypothetical protein ANCDUO_24947 [Ancylostoma duodenale]
MRLPAKSTITTKECFHSGYNWNKHHWKREESCSSTCESEACSGRGCIPSCSFFFKVRVRDRLVGLLSASGLRVGLPSAVSVVFSQSELGSTASSTERICTSSQEVASTTSLPDPSASITDSFPRVFKEFDFLEAEHDSVSETADSCFGWLSTMRPRSIGGDEPQHDDDADVDEDEVRVVALICFEYAHSGIFQDSESAQANSEGGGASTSRLSRTSISSDRTPCPSEVDEEEDGNLFREKCSC